MPEITEWTCQNDYEFHNQEFVTFKSREGLWGYSYSECEHLVLGFATEEDAMSHAHSHAYETMVERACDFAGDLT